jgi:hypothetical protein
MNFTSKQQQQSSRSQEREGSADIYGNKRFPSSFMGDYPLVEQQQLDPIFDINTLLRSSRPGTSDNIQAVVAMSTGDVVRSSCCSTSLLLDATTTTATSLPDIMDSAAATVLQGIKNKNASTVAANRNVVVVTTTTPLPPPG